MTFVNSRILSSPRRDDGHDDHGNPGDCLRAAVATVMDLPYEQVPHFAQVKSWWTWMRRWTRTEHGTGVERVDEVFVWCHPYGDLPDLVALTAREN